MANFKVVLLGEGRVGKTSIGRRWTEDRFEQTVRSTVAAAYFQKVVTTKGGRSFMIHLWDPAGQEEFHSLTPIYYKDSQAAILVFAVTDDSSFDRMTKWKNELLQTRGNDIKLVVVANKIDLEKERVVSRERGEEFARTVRAEYFEVSAKTGLGIDRVFSHLADLLATFPVPTGPSHKRGRAGLQVVSENRPVEETGKKGGCC
jgi:small GTP-binding protein